MGNMKYAPVIIPTLCRYEHFRRCIESLKKNPWAKYTDIYIGLDYPAKEEHWDGYNKICEYLDTGDFSAFKAFNVIKRKENLGAVKNSDALVDEIKTKYDCWIYSEDDNEFSYNFLEYMDKCLAMYEDDERIIAVSGYSQPLDWVSDPDSNIMLQSVVAPAWGGGYWREKSKHIDAEISGGCLVKNFDMAYKTGLLKKMIKRRRITYTFGCLLGSSKTLMLRPCDISYTIYAAINDMYVVIPTLSKVSNHGYDGSGTYCKKIRKTNNNLALSYDYDNQPIDSAETFEPRLDSVIDRSENKELIGKFFDTPLSETFYSSLAMIAYKLLGVKRYKIFAEKVLRRIFPQIFSYKYLEEYKGD